ncbi:MAG: hypothetical protein AAGH99_10410 [Planctomycetota bacterium]
MSVREREFLNTDRYKFGRGRPAHGNIEQEIDRLRSHVAKVKAWRATDDALRPTPVGISTEQDEKRYIAWLGKHPRPEPDLFPSDPVFDLTRYRELLGHGTQGQAVPNANDEGEWVARYRYVLGEVRCLTELVPSITRDPLLQRCEDALAGLADAEQWFRTATLANAE